jgi:hypothetical protein
MADTSIAASLLSGLLVGVVGAVLNHLFTRKKMLVETKLSELNIEKLTRELFGNLTAAVSHELVAATERLIYSSAGHDIGHDFQGRRAQIWAVVDGKNQAVSPFGEGVLTVEGGEILNIQRSNTDGRFEVLLQHYMFDGQELASIPRNDLLLGKRSLRLSCEAKVAGAEHKLRFVFKNEKTDQWVAHTERPITANIWTPVNVYFQISPTEECIFRIDDLEVTRAPSSIQIRNIVLAEKVSLAS